MGESEAQVASHLPEVAEPRLPHPNITWVSVPGQVIPWGTAQVEICSQPAELWQLSLGRLRRPHWGAACSPWPSARLGPQSLEHSPCFHNGPPVAGRTVLPLELVAFKGVVAGGGLYRVAPPFVSVYLLEMLSL